MHVPSEKPNIVFTITQMLKLGRLHFLISGVLLNTLGLIVSVYAGYPIRFGVFLLGQLAITATQIMVHYANDYYDLESDRLNQTPTNWSGGSRVLIQGNLNPSIALRLAAMSSAVAIVTILILSVIVHPGIWTFPILMLAFVLSWAYSAPPIRLHSRGIGEIAATITVAVLTPLTGYYLQSGTLDKIILLVVIPLCALQFAMLISVALPDRIGDQLSDKYTLVVRLGVVRSLRLHMLLISSPFILMPILVVLGMPTEVGAALYFLFPIAMGIVWFICSQDHPESINWNVLAFYTIVLFVAAIAVKITAFLLVIGLR